MLVMAVAAIVVSVGYIVVASATNWKTVVTIDGGSPAQAAPQPSLVSESPTSTPSPTHETAAEPWKFEGAWLTIPCLGIERMDITEYTKADLVTEQVWSPDKQGYVKVPDMIVPRTPETIAWYSSLKQKSILSVEATNTVYLFLHSIYGADGIFNEIPKLTPKSDCEVIIETPTERLTFTVAKKSFEVDKDKLKSAKGYTEAVEGRLLIVTCYTEGAYVDGHATKNAVSTLQLIRAESLVPATVTLTQWQLDHTR